MTVCARGRGSPGSSQRRPQVGTRRSVYKGVDGTLLERYTEDRTTNSSGQGRIIPHYRGRTASIQIVIERLFFGASPQLIARPAFKLAHALPR